MKITEPPKPLRALANWCGIFSWIFILVVFIYSHISQPAFVVQYEDMNSVPISAIQKGFGLAANPLTNGIQPRLLRLKIVNNSSSGGAKDVKVVVADYVRKLDFIMEESVVLPSKLDSQGLGI